MQKPFTMNVKDETLEYTTMSHKNPLDEIKKHEEAIAALKEEAVAQLRAREAELNNELEVVRTEIEKLTGKPAEKRTRKTKAEGKKPDLQELKAMLSKALDKTLNIRNAGLDTANIKTLAKANPGLLKLGGKAPWPTVTLVK
jgi:hypothetical protein